MSKRNPVYDFKWCPGCGDFGVKRAIEGALVERSATLSESVENSAIVAGIGCSGNLVHLQEGPQPFGIHGIHGRTLPDRLRPQVEPPDVNVLVVSGDGDFLSIGAEHIGPQAKRNLDITVDRDGQRRLRPHQGPGLADDRTRGRHLDHAVRQARRPMSPLETYLAAGVGWLASSISTQVKALQQLIVEAMAHPGFSIVHVQSPCNHLQRHLRRPQRRRERTAWSRWPSPFPEEHDPCRPGVRLPAGPQRGRIPIGMVYQRPDSVPAQERLNAPRASAPARSKRPSRNSSPPWRSSLGAPAPTRT